MYCLLTYYISLNTKLKEIRRNVPFIFLKSFPLAGNIQSSQCRPVFVSHRCDCLRLGDKCVLLPLCCRGNPWLQCPGELEALHSCRVKCMLGHPPAKRSEQGAIDLLEVCGQSFWTQYHLSACQEALCQQQRTFVSVHKKPLCNKKSFIPELLEF